MGRVHGQMQNALLYLRGGAMLNVRGLHKIEDGDITHAAVPLDSCLSNYWQPNVDFTLPFATKRKLVLIPYRNILCFILLQQVVEKMRQKASRIQTEKVNYSPTKII